MPANNRNDRIKMPMTCTPLKPQLPPNDIDGENEEGEALGRQLRKNNPPRMYRKAIAVTTEDGRWTPDRTRGVRSW